MRVVKVGGSGALRKRLLEMGLTRGETMNIVKYAPLRDPMELVVKGSHVSLRVGEAEQIEVQKGPVDDTPETGTVGHA